MTLRSPVSTLSALLLASTLGLPTALAQTVPVAKAAREGSFGKKGSGPLLTRTQLRECFAQQERLRTGSDEAAALRTQLEADKAEIQRSGAELRDGATTLDRTSQEAVDAYNAKINARNERIAAFDAQVPVLDAKAAALGAEREAFARNCENRRYDEADEAALRKAR